MLQAGGAYLVNSSFYTSDTKYAQNGENYLESKDFRLMYPDISLKQVRLDITYLYGMLVSSNKKDKKESLHSNMKPARMMLWHELNSIEIMTTMDQKKLE